MSLLLFLLWIGIFIIYHLSLIHHYILKVQKLQGEIILIFILQVDLLQNNNNNNNKTYPANMERAF